VAARRESRLARINCLLKVLLLRPAPRERYADDGCASLRCLCPPRQHRSATGAAERTQLTVRQETAADVATLLSSSTIRHPCRVPFHRAFFPPGRWPSSWLRHNPITFTRTLPFSSKSSWIFELGSSSTMPRLRGQRGAHLIRRLNRRTRQNSCASSSRVAVNGNRLVIARRRAVSVCCGTPPGAAPEAQH
jgi:hypothetical protein